MLKRIFLLLISCFALLAGAALLSGCASQQAAAPTPTPAPTPVVAQKPAYIVKRGEVIKSLRLVGRATPVKQQDLFFRADGYVREVYAARGDVVKAGEVLALLDDPEKFVADVARAELDVEQARYDLEELRSSAPIKAAEAQVALVEAELKLVEACNMLLGLKGRPDSTDLLVQKARADYAITEEKLKEARQKWEWVDQRKETNPRRLIALNALLDAIKEATAAQALLKSLTQDASQADIARAEADQALAEAKFTAAQETWEQLKDGPNPQELRLAEARVAEAEARLAIAQKALANIELSAPFDGQVVSISLTPGGAVTAFRTVLTFADPGELELTAFPTSEELSSLGVGQRAVLQLNSRPGEELDAEVYQVPLFDPSASQAEENHQDQAVHIRLEDPTVPLTLGETAGIDIHIEARQGVLWLPVAALRTFQGRDFVFIEENGVQRRVDVVLGLQSSERVEILEGLQEGQVVVGQ
jgi:RND family efflux transporter MFP subunit